MLNLLAEYWSRVTISDFSTSLIAAVLLQLLLQATLALEHWVGGHFKNRSGTAWAIARFLSAWLVLFGSKFVMLGAIDRLFGDAVHFDGPMHGVGTFIVVVVLILIAEEATTRIHRSLA
ncbi:MAG: hypothetical protein AB8B57_07050 [Congregibacter sp.]